MVRGWLRFLYPFTSETPRGRWLMYGFVAVVLLKAVAAIFFCNGDLYAFFRFATVWLDSGLSDPWEYYAKCDPGGAAADPPTFPYPPGMLLFIGLLRGVTYALGLTSFLFTPLGALPISLGRWILDLATGGLLYKIAGKLGLDSKGQSRVFWGWTIGLVPIWATFLKCHIDIAAVFLTVLSLHFLLSRYFIAAGIALAAAVATKHYPLVLLAPWSIYVMQVQGLTLVRRAVILASFVASLVLTGLLLYSPYLHGEQFQAKVLFYHEASRIWYPVYTYIAGSMWAYAVVVIAAFICLMGFTSTADPRRTLIITSTCLLLIFTTVIIPMGIWFLWSAPLVVLLCAMITRGTFMWHFYGIAYAMYYAYMQYTSLYQLAVYRGYGWPMRISPWKMVAAKAGDQAAQKLEMILFSVLLAGALGIIASSVLRPSLTLNPELPVAEPERRRLAFRDARAWVCGLLMVAACSAVLHWGIGAGPKLSRARLLVGGEIKETAFLRYQYKGSERWVRVVPTAERVVIEAIPGEGGATGNVFARPFAGDKLMLDSFDLGKDWTVWSKSRLLHKGSAGGGTGQEVSMASLEKEEAAVLTHVDLLEYKDGGKARVRIGSRVLFEGSLRADQEHFERIVLPKPDTWLEVSVPAEASEVCWVIAGKETGPPEVMVGELDGVSVADRLSGSKVYDQSKKSWIMRLGPAAP